MPELTKIQTGFIEPQSPLELDSGTQSAPSIHFEGDENTGLYKAAEDEIGVSIGGTEKYKFTSEGLKFSEASLDGTPYIGKYNKDINDSATDVFIYDTSKDSDGGAWRKRTSHTSWYNEEAAADRGTRKEFPAVAVIVAESTQLTIYDGDDPDLPMWMVFNLLGSVGSSSNMLPRGGSSSVSDITSITCLNADLIVGLKDIDGSVGEGPVKINFISDFARVYREIGSGFTGAIYNLPISGRNSNSSYLGDYDNLSVISQRTNDVAITVLPNAPIDPSTDLPVPTIAIATDLGATIIKDNNISYNITSSKTYKGVKKIYFDDDNYIWFSAQGSSSASTGIYEVVKYEIDRVGITNNTYDQYSIASYFPGGPDAWGGYLPAWNGIYPVNDGNDENIRHISPFKGGAVIGNNNGISLIHENLYYQNDGMANYISSSYNTGWMHGNIKGAFLSDITTGSISINANLASSATQTDTGRLTSENYISGATTWQMVDNDANDNGYLELTFGGLTVKKSYVISITLDNNAMLDAGYNHRIDHSGGGSTQFTNWNKYNASSEILTGIFTSTSTNSEKLVIYANGITINVSNFLIKEVEIADRSTNIKGMSVYGSITKNIIATGTDLVSYTGIDQPSGNYIEQPHNLDLNFGQGDFSIITWAYIASGTDGDSYIFGRRTVSTEGIFGYYNYGSDYLRLRTSENGTYATTDVESANIRDRWICISYVRRSRTQYVYIDGIERASTISTKNINSNGKLTIGWTEPFPETARPTNKFALFRISASAPSAEQIKKIYDDEKVLFQANAKATLYGSTDAVTALAYDDTTNLLNVGTSSGRSTFNGLRRINNTTEEVTTVISAHDGSIAQQ